MIPLTSGSKKAGQKYEETSQSSEEKDKDDKEKEKGIEEYFFFFSRNRFTVSGFSISLYKTHLIILINLK